MKYEYYDSPEGEDCFKKLYYTSKLAALTGISVATLDIVFRQPQGYSETIARYGYYTLPFIGIAAAFTSTVCVATSVRHKDDQLNYFLGGCASGAVYGAWKRSTYSGFRAGLFLGIAAVLKKMSVEEGWSFIPDVKPSSGSFRLSRHDWTILKDPPKNWRTTEE